MALAFRDSEALQVVVRGGLCPADVLARGARVGIAADGALVVAPDTALSAAALGRLRAIGVEVDAPLPQRFRDVRCWAEAIAPVRAPVPEIPALVLFVTARAAQLLDLASELVRLGCDRVELLVVGDRGVARVVDPPTYSVVRAIDRERGLRVFAPDPVGQERVWTELGYTHPLVTAADLGKNVRPPDDSLLLIPGDATAWFTLPAEGWRGLDAALELAVPGTPVTHARSSALPARRRIELRLATGRREAPSLWVLREGGVAAIDQLLGYLPEDVVARLTFAATAGEAPILIVRARTGRTAAPDLALATGEAYAPLGQMPDVYAPAGAIVEPPLRRERLRAVLEVAPGEVMWLARTGDAGAFRSERISDAAFAPLSDWADYVLHASAPLLEPWMRATELDFAAYVSTGMEWAAGSGSAAAPDPARLRARNARARTPEAPSAPVAARPVVRPPPAVAPPTRAAESAGPTQVAIDRELAELENEFVALDAPADAPERLALLVRLGAAYARLGRRRDAGLCFARATWELPLAAAAAQLDGWIAADLHGAAPDAALARALAEPKPGLDDVRAVAAIAARGTPAVSRDPHRVQRWLDDHDTELDARTLWLARTGLARLAGGDALGLAHARDRILARLAGGLPVERELPAFLRFAGRSGALGASSGEHLRDALGELATRLARTKRKRGPVEAPVALTNAYVALLLAHGYARIGYPDRARTGIAEARTTLGEAASDPVHAYLLAAFEARIEQAIAGQPPETPLPDALGPQLAALDRKERYKVDRLREVSWILEPVERPDAIGAFARQQRDSRGPEFAALRALPDAAARAKAVDELVATAIAPATNEAERERLLDGVFDVLLELPEAAAAPILARAWPRIATLPEPRRAMLYTAALVVAGHFGRTEIVPDILRDLKAAVRVVPGAELERVVQQSVRALRRIGLRVEIIELLAQAEAALPATREDALRGRLALATGLAFLGEYARALPVFEQARAALAGGAALKTSQMDLARSLALAYANAPLATALAGIADLSTLLKDQTDSLSTNSHFCLTVLHFVESLVLGITSDDLAIGEAGRRFIEDDEHLIRRRLHRDLGGLST